MKAWNAEAELLLQYGAQFYNELDSSNSKKKIPITVKAFNYWLYRRKNLSKIYNLLIKQTHVVRL
jgi:hypothetical protein